MLQGHNSKQAVKNEERMRMRMRVLWDEQKECQSRLGKS